MGAASLGAASLGTAGRPRLRRPPAATLLGWGVTAGLLVSTAAGEPVAAEAEEREELF